MSTLAMRFREKVGKMKKGTNDDQKFEQVHPVAYSTGFLSFDFRNGSVIHAKRPDGTKYDYYSVGVADGSMVLIIGRSGSGKTTYCIQAGANIIRNHKSSSMFIEEAEVGGSNQSRKMILTKFDEETFNQKVIIRDTGVTAESFYKRIKLIHDEKLEAMDEITYDTGLYDPHGNRIFKLEPTIVILDSIAMLMPEKYADEDELAGQMAATAAAKANSAIFKRIIPMLKKANIILFAINHINEDVSINPMQRKKAQVSYLKQGETCPGGRAVTYLANTFVRIDDHSKLKAGETFGIDGNIMDFTLIKSRSNKAGQSATLVFNQDSGFDEELSLFLLLKDNGRINGAGAYLYVGDYSECKFAQKNFKTKLRENPELRRVFMTEVSSLLKEMASNQIAMEKEELAVTPIGQDILSMMNGEECCLGV